MSEHLHPSIYLYFTGKGEGVHIPQTVFPTNGYITIFFLLISSYTISVSFSIHSLSPVPLGKDCSNLISINSLSDSTHLYVGIINKDIVIEYEIKKKKYTEKVYSYSLSISLVC